MYPVCMNTLDGIVLTPSCDEKPEGEDKESVEMERDEGD